MTQSAEQATTVQTDVLVIGWGKAGKTLAGALGRAGRSVTIVEQSADMIGGTCINIGCVPTKALVHQAQERREDDLLITAETVIVGTGSVPRRMDVPGADGPRIHDSTSIQHVSPFPQPGDRRPTSSSMRAGVTASQLRDGIWTHPSTTEALNEVLA